MGRLRISRGTWGAPVACVCLAVVAPLASSGCLTPSRPAGKTPYQIGRDAAAAGDFATAVAQLTLAVKTEENAFFTAAHLDRGECHIALARLAEKGTKREEHWAAALADFDAVLAETEESVQPSDRARAFYHRGVVLLEQAQPAQAEEAFRAVLDVRLPPEQSRFEREARRELGWLYLEGAMTSLEESPSAQEELASQERFRRAQEQFSRGLEIAPEDENMNLGKGLCLHFRGQDREAVECLRRSTESSETRGTLNPRGHFYLARALEDKKGRQAAALEHYSLAVEQDPERTFAPLYEELVEVLPVYLGFQDPRFHWFLDRMLSFAQKRDSYWQSVESLADRLIEDAEPGDSPEAIEQKAQGVFARALARARIGTREKIDEAVGDALRLKDSPRFSEYVSRIFPSEPPLPENLYGKASALLGADRHAELDALFQDPAFAALDASAKGSSYYEKAMVLQGRSILQRWLAGEGSAPPSSTDAKIVRDRTLGKARDAFLSYLERHPEDHDVRMTLGQVQELMESYATAYLSYAMVAESRPETATAYQRIVRLHEGRLLPQTDMVTAWDLLRTYAGTDPTVVEYVRRTRETIRTEVSLHCTFCGRRGAQGDTTCLECGTPIGQVARASEDGPSGARQPEDVRPPETSR